MIWEKQVSFKSSRCRDGVRAHVVPIRRQTDNEPYRAVREDPRRHARLRADITPRAPHLVDRRKGADGVADIVRAVREGRGARGHDLGQDAHQNAGIS